MQNETNTAPSLCEAMGLDADAFHQFLAQKDLALAQKDANAEQYARKALLAEMAWAE
jgi:hypothetical protein